MRGEGEEEEEKFVGTPNEEMDFICVKENERKRGDEVNGKNIFTV